MINNKNNPLFPDIRLRFLLIITFSVIAILTYEIDLILFLYIASLWITGICGGDIFLPFRKYKFMLPFIVGVVLVHLLFSREGTEVLSIGSVVIIYSEGLKRIILAAFTMLIVFTNSSIIILSLIHI